MVHKPDRSCNASWDRVVLILVQDSQKITCFYNGYRYITHNVGLS